MTFEESAKSMLEAADAVRSEFTSRFNAAVAANDPIAYSQELGFADSAEDVDKELGYGKRSPIKFVYKAQNALTVVDKYLPYFKGLKSCYEIGVGVGYLLRALIDVHGIDARGCDVGLDERGVYREMRAKLGLTSLVEEQMIEAGTPIRLPAGTEAVTTFMSVFDFQWSANEYRWFFDEMKRNNVSKVLWRPNRTDEESREFFTSIGGVFPLEWDANRFVVISL